MRFLFLLLFSACIIPTGQFARTSNPRSGIWVTDNGFAWAWHVDNIEVIHEHCPRSVFIHGCVLWTPGNKFGEIWTIDSARMAAHECAHALAFSRAKNREQIEAELIYGMEIAWFPDGSAREKPCER